METKNNGKKTVSNQKIIQELEKSIKSLSRLGAEISDIGAVTLKATKSLVDLKDSLEKMEKENENAD